LLLRNIKGKMKDMIDLPTQKDMVHPHHRRAVWALIAAGALLGAVLAGYYLRPSEPVEQGSQGDLAKKQALMNEPAPVLNLTAAEIKSRQALLDKDAPTLKLTPEQIKARQDLLNQ
jgi:hypothetical protein